MLYEVELRRHRETHRLFSATSSQLAQWREEREKRIVSFKKKKKNYTRGSWYSCQRWCAKTLLEWVNESPWCDVQNAMQSTSLVPVKQVRQTIDSRDKFAQRICSFLGQYWDWYTLLLKQKKGEKMLFLLYRNLALFYCPGPNPCQPSGGCRAACSPDYNSGGPPSCTSQWTAANYCWTVSI